MIICLLNGMISLINMTYSRVRTEPELQQYDKELLQHLLDKGLNEKGLMGQVVGWDEASCW